MTDERIGEGLWRAIIALPPGSGIVFRHFETPAADRRALFARILRIARGRRLVLIRAGRARLAGEHGIHGPGRLRSDQIRTWPAHSRREAVAGRRANADLIFVSPVFPTRTHPGVRALGVWRAAIIAQGIETPAIALGGMNAARFERLERSGFYGWAAITALSGDQKRNAVPI